ncbi:MAG: type II toxin-antitoxin system HipA family toxin [Pelistega sp.]|nr:type II toxin-antitoxin system HipA family toxin [Pelistega sp.]
MQKYYVHLLLENSATPTVVRAGTLLVESHLGKYDTRGSFTYDDTYLNNPRAFPIDPINLPLRTESFEFLSTFHIAGGIFDLLPDAWGDNILTTMSANQSELDAEQILAVISRTNWLGKENVGAVRFQASRHNENTFTEVLDKREKESRLQDLVSQQVVDELFEEFFPDIPNPETLWQIGGARPKAHIERNGSSWIAKFNSKPKQGIEPINSTAIEYGIAKFMKDKLGMDVVDVDIAIVNADHCACLVKRFDQIELDNGAYQQLHFLSFSSLVSLPPPYTGLNTLQRERQKVLMSYPNMARIAQQLCSKEKNDVAETFYKRMLINVLFNNTDDHLKNHAILFNPLTKQYKLSPAYDVSAQFLDKGYHKPIHMCNLRTDVPYQEAKVGSFENLIGGGLEMGLKKPKILALTKEIVEVYRDFKHFFQSLNIPINERTKHALDKLLEEKLLIADQFFHKGNSSYN